MKFLFLSFLLFVPVEWAYAGSEIPLIFDTDMGNDIDDALALAVIHALESRGECRLIGVTLTKEHDLAAPFVDAINTFYGRGQIPIGTVENGKGREGSTYLEVSKRKHTDGSLVYPHDLRSKTDAEDAVKLLRRLLSSEDDGSVIIVQVGFSTNLANLLRSGPDEISSLNGRELVQRKVKLLSAMAGNFVSDRPEFNVNQDVESAQQVLQQWPTDVILSGYEIGTAIPYPSESIVEDFGYIERHIVEEAYRAYAEMPYDRPTWDLTSVLYAVRPFRGYFNLSVEGEVKVDSEGRTSFHPDSDGRSRYLQMTSNQKVKVLEALVQLTSSPPCTH